MLDGIFFLFSVFWDLSSIIRWERAAGVGWGLGGGGGEGRIHVRDRAWFVRLYGEIISEL